MIPIFHVFIISIILFSIGIVGFFIHRNLYALLLMIGFMFQASAVGFAGLKSTHSILQGQIFLLLEFIIIAAGLLISLIAINLSIHSLGKTNKPIQQFGSNPS